MTFVVRISDQFQIDGIAVYVLMKHEGEVTRVMHITEAGFTQWEPVEDQVIPRPTFTLPNDVGRATLEALIRHYEGAPDLHTVRSDLLHERGRVDKLMNHLMGTATTAVDALSSDA